MYQPTSLQLDVFKYFKDKIFPYFIHSHTQTIDSKIIEYENDNFIYLILEENFFYENSDNHFFYNNEIKKTEAIDLYKKGVSFEMLAFDLINKTQKYTPYYPFFKRNNYQLRFSKIYGRLEISEMFSGIHFIETVPKNRRKSNSERRDFNFYNIKHKIHKVISINKNNKTLIYNNFIPRYISLKNFILLPKFNAAETSLSVWIELSFMLLNGQLNSEFDFEHYSNALFYNIENKLSYGKKNFKEILHSLVPNIPRALEEKESVINLINLFKLIKKEDHKRVFDFYDQCLKYNIQFSSEGTGSFSVAFISKLICTSKNLSVQKFSNGCFITSPLHSEDVAIVDNYIQTCYRYNKKINLDFSSMIKIEYETNLIENLSVKFNPPPKHYRLESLKNFFEKNKNVEIKLITNRKEFSELIKKINLKIFSIKKAIYYFKITLSNNEIEEGIIEIIIDKKNTFDYKIRGAWESFLSNYTKYTLNELMVLFFSHKLAHNTKTTKVEEEEIELPF